MYERVLLAYDGSREGRTALREGALAARRFGAQVYLLCVVAESPGVRIGEAAHAGAVAKSQDTYGGLFDEAMERLKALGFRPEGKVVTGDPAAEIAGYAHDVKADLVVVGHRKKGLLERWWAGETGAYLADHLTCSLLVARRAVSDEEFYGELDATAAG
ncbi:MAG: universal stress protein [Alphaproteobacteria bacterium]|nr:universal stress protein [Alphaproteobacteria bacterium]MBU1514688.1 universal stress protein [Alphaproteobacteria bacterium]MBU2093547.1 universal stress protein [Alphaproteobacteria bacterium]MBU2149461.1 universal stress protein [Alphaproteobacteria bacterium]MBU2305496.1 universal stress protein [Alphaproteobacteria bacterium]